MIATDVNSLTSAANAYQAISTPMDALRVQISLLQQIYQQNGGASQSGQQLITNANQYQNIADPTLARQVIIGLLAQIVAAI